MAGGLTEDWYREHQQRVAGMSPRAPLRLVDRDACLNPPKTSVAVEAKANAGASKRKPVVPEEEIQVLVAAFLDRALPRDYRWLHIPNGGARSKREGGLFKAMGVKAGAADVLILTPVGKFIWIELKTATGRLRPGQEDWRDWCRSIGAPWFLCRSLDDVIEALESLQIRLRVRA